jgi:hypothetical protein
MKQLRWTVQYFSLGYFFELEFKNVQSISIQSVIHFKKMFKCVTNESFVLIYCIVAISLIIYEKHV